MGDNKGPRLAFGAKDLHSHIQNRYRKNYAYEAGRQRPSIEFAFRQLLRRTECAGDIAPLAPTAFCKNGHRLKIVLA